MTLVLCGGHLTPALALLEYAQRHHHTVIFFGRLYNQGRSQQSHEEQEVCRRGATFIPFDSGKLHERWWATLFSLPVSIVAWLKALYMLKKIAPDCVVSFGGYLAVPVVLAAWMLRIPVVTHEQTRASGVANKFIGHFARAIAVSYPETLTDFPSGKTFLIGNPIRHTLTQKQTKRPAWFHSKHSLPILYITGGSQGSQVINATVLQLLPKLVAEWQVIHQCGNPTKHMNYKAELVRRQHMLRKAHQTRYMVHEWLSEEDQVWVYHHADAIVSRAGANTVMEIAVLGKPALFIPLPFAHGDEQTKNAQALVDAGAALLLSQKELSPATLLSALRTLATQLPSLLSSARMVQQKFDTQADQRLCALIERVVTIKA